ncbi:sensor histidine kinase [Terriglobus roseus]|uniref:histidine kinase n=1 Tax=Terriglobus roseus TaxID=392734 RepID=A0A1G7HG28_9BACT|nr:ATP-binding protein [Terriglobus roseus]SDE99338.1 PAS fold [Terriglobus roseus]
MIRWWLKQRPQTVLFAAVLCVTAIALCDWRITFNATLGFLYIFPLAMLGTILRVWQIIGMAIFCMTLSSVLDPFSMDALVPRSILIFLTLATVGLLSRQIATGYRSEMESLTRLQDEVEARKVEIASRLAAEEQLDFLVQSSPAAVFTVSDSGEILIANPATHALLDVPAGSLCGSRIGDYIPELAAVPSVDETTTVYRTEMQTHGRRRNGEVFVANVFFSTYRTPAGPRLAALVVDASEDLREREEASLEQMLTGSHILVAAVSHEIRNVCGAIRVVHENLSRSGILNGNQDFESLGALTKTLARITSLELRRSTGGAAHNTFNAQDVLTDFRIVLERSCAELDITLAWDVPSDLPLVRADRQLLMQILLNLTKNSQFALEGVDDKWISVSARHHGNFIVIAVDDNGPGIPVGRSLFEPLQKGAHTTGLGLYLSRAFARSFHGELRHVPTSKGCSFVLELPLVGRSENSGS